MWWPGRRRENPQKNRVPRRKVPRSEDIHLGRSRRLLPMQRMAETGDRRDGSSGNIKQGSGTSRLVQGWILRGRWSLPTAGH